MALTGGYVLRPDRFALMQIVIPGSSPCRGQQGSFGKAAQERDPDVTVQFLDDYAETQWEVRSSSQDRASCMRADEAWLHTADDPAFHGRLGRGRGKTRREGTRAIEPQRTHGFIVRSLSEVKSPGQVSPLIMFLAPTEHSHCGTCGSRRKASSSCSRTSTPSCGTCCSYTSKSLRSVARPTICSAAIGLQY